MNPSDKEITMLKGITLAYLEKSPFQAKRQRRVSSGQETNQKIKTGKVKGTHQVNEIIKKDVRAMEVPIVPENSALMTNENFYPKPQVPLENAETSAETKQK